MTRTHLTEFPDVEVPPELVALAERGILEDTSWHNDECPSFEWYGPHRWGYRIWVQWDKPEERGMGARKDKFIIDRLAHVAAEGWHLGDWPVFLETSNLPLLLRVVAHWEEERRLWAEANPLAPPPKVAAVVERAKREVLADIAAGRVPPTVQTFAELHDYVDANGYGGAFESWYEGCTGEEEFTDFWNRVQSEVDVWLRAGRPREDGTQ